MHTFNITFDEQYEFIKLYDILRDMDFELTDLQESVFEKVLNSEFISLPIDDEIKELNFTTNGGN